MVHTSDISTGERQKLKVELVQGLGESLVSDDPLFSGFPTRIVWDKERQVIVAQTPGTKQRQSVLSETGGTETIVVDSNHEFLNQPDARRVTLALAEIGEQVEEESKRDIAVVQTNREETAL